MRITILTLFPEMFDGFLSTSIIARAISRGLVTVDFVNYRDFAHDTYRHVDDSPFGGGAGMVMKCQPVLDALNSVKTENCHTILLTPTGTQYGQVMAHNYAAHDHLIILCGHYEGMDARIYSHVDELVSIGDYVLTGGELASMVIADSVIRLLHGSIKEDSANDESYENGLLEYPQYTQPADYEGDKVPEVLLSGDHEKVRKWRLKESLKLTRIKRPDLFARHQLNKEEQKLVYQIEDEEADNKQ